jgi:hypothetical protein
MSYWTEEQIARAAKIWNDGGSATDIGNALGCSRGAAMGIVHRNRSQFNEKPKRIRQERLPKPVSAKLDRIIRARALKLTSPVMVETVPVVEEPDPDFTPSRPIKFLHVTETTCRWPLWQMPDNPGAEGLCCGDPTDGGSWCRHHRLLARDKSKARAA